MRLARAQRLTGRAIALGRAEARSAVRGRGVPGVSHVRPTRTTETGPRDDRPHTGATSLQTCLVFSAPRPRPSKSPGIHRKNVGPPPSDPGVRASAGLGGGGGSLERTRLAAIARRGRTKVVCGMDPGKSRNIPLQTLDRVHQHLLGSPGADGAPGAPPTPNRIWISAEKAMLFGGLCATGRQERSTVSHACSPDARPRRSRGGECPIRLALPERFRAHGVRAVQVPCPGSSAELLASHFRRIADPARLTPPPDLRFPRHASMCGPLTLGRPLNRISVLRRTGGSPSTYVLVWQHGPVTISGRGPKRSHAYISFRHRRSPYHRFWFASHWSCCRSRR